MFLGRYHHNLDDKGRLTIPARYRELVAIEGAYVMQGFDKNLMVLTSSSFDVLSRRVNGMNVGDPTTRILRRMIFSTADRVEVDKAGRILIPQFLRQYAELAGDTVLIGMGDYFEIWSPVNWELQDEQLQDAQANAQRFSALDLSTGPVSAS